MEWIEAVTGARDFYNTNFILALREERRGKPPCDDVNNSKLKEIFDDLKGTDQRLILHTKITGACLNVRGNTVTGTVLAAT